MVTATGVIGRATTARPSPLKLATRLPATAGSLPVDCSTTTTGACAGGGVASSTDSPTTATSASPDSARHGARRCHQGAGAGAAAAAAGHSWRSTAAHTCGGGATGGSDAVNGIRRSCQSRTAARSAGWPGSSASKRRRAGPRRVPAT